MHSCVSSLLLLTLLLYHFIFQNASQSLHINTINFKQVVLNYFLEIKDIHSCHSSSLFISSLWLTSTLSKKMGERNHDDYHRYLKFKKDKEEEKQTEKKYVWYNPRPNDRYSFASAEVIQEGNNEWILRTNDGQVCLYFHC